MCRLIKTDEDFSDEVFVPWNFDNPHGIGAKRLVQKSVIRSYNL